MSDEVSLSLRIAITLVLIGALMSSVILVYYNSNALLSSSQNGSVEAMEIVSTQNIMRLRNDYRHYIDLYKTYEYYEESINSIYGVELDGTQHIHYLRNADWVNPESPLSAVCATQGLTGIQNIDNMYNNFMNEYCDEEHSSVWISILIYPDKNRLGYDIYYEVVDRQGG